MFENNITFAFLFFNLLGKEGFLVIILNLLHPINYMYMYYEILPALLQKSFQASILFYAQLCVSAI